MAAKMQKNEGYRVFFFSKSQEDTHTDENHHESRRLWSSDRIISVAAAMEPSPSLLNEILSRSVVNICIDLFKKTAD